MGSDRYDPRPRGAKEGQRSSNKVPSRHKRRIIEMHAQLFKCKEENSVIQISTLRQNEETNRGIQQEQDAVLDSVQAELGKIGGQRELVEIEDLTKQLEAA